MNRALSFSLPAFLFGALLYSGQAFAKNDPSDCHYFSEFVVAIKKAHDAGQTQAQTVAFARKKALADRLDVTTTNLFVGEAIGFYYDHPQYAGTPEKVHDQAYGNCMAGTLP